MEELFKSIIELQNALQNMPDNSEQEFEIGGIKVIVTKGTVEKDFDDSEIKEIVDSFKESIKELDDEVFVEALEDMRGVLDVNELDRLLALDSFSEEEAENVERMIGVSSSIISDKLHDRIQALIGLLDKF